MGAIAPPKKNRKKRKIEKERKKEEKRKNKERKKERKKKKGKRRKKGNRKILLLYSFSLQSCAELFQLHHKQCHFVYILFLKC